MCELKIVCSIGAAGHSRVKVVKRFKTRFGFPLERVKIATHVTI